MSQETASYWQSPSSREKNLQKLRPQIHGRGLRQARRGGSLHPAQSQDRQIHHILPLYRQVTVIWNWYQTEIILVHSLNLQAPVLKFADLITFGLRLRLAEEFQMPI